jgi:hypothetical protein
MLPIGCWLCAFLSVAIFVATLGLGDDPRR